MWFITVFSKCELDKNGWPDYGATRTWGYYEEKGKDTHFFSRCAFMCLRRNKKSIF